MKQAKIKLRKLPWVYLGLISVIVTCWAIYMFSTHSFYLYLKHYYAAITMLFGATIAGSTPEGAGAIVFPVFTIFLKIPPPVARNFTFAIQSIGMTCASVFILNSKIKVDWIYIKYVTFGGLFGLALGMFYVAPLIPGPVAKLFFVSLWLAFGIVLWVLNRKDGGEVYDTIVNFGRSDMFRLLILGFIGGIISSIFGTGVNIFSFCFMVIYYRISEKTAVPSSVIIMTIETLIGFGTHVAVLRDFQPQAFQMWLVCIPVVMICAPLGAYLINKVARKGVAKFLAIVLCLQYIGAMFVLRPVNWEVIMSVSVLIAGLLGFFGLSKLPRKPAVPAANS